VYNEGGKDRKMIGMGPLGATFLASDGAQSNTLVALKVIPVQNEAEVRLGLLKSFWGFVHH